MGPKNGIVGEGFGTELPQTQVEENELLIEKRMAGFSKTAEYKKLEEHINDRISFYQTCLPDGRPASEAPTLENWVIANAVIGELKAILGAYEQARRVVEDSANV